MQHAAALPLRAAWGLVLGLVASVSWTHAERSVVAQPNGSSTLRVVANAGHSTTRLYRGAPTGRVAARRSFYGYQAGDELTPLGTPQRPRQLRVSEALVGEPLPAPAEAVPAGSGNGRHAALPGPPMGAVYQPLTSLNLGIDSPAGEMPEDYSQRVFGDPVPEAQAAVARGEREMIAAHFRSADICYRPLFFEDITLERYGHHYGCLQPAVSAVRFFGRIPIVPYLAGANPPCRCKYNTGHYRPGDCVPFHRYRLPKSLRGAGVQALVVTGLVFIVP